MSFPLQRLRRRVMNAGCVDISSLSSVIITLIITAAVCLTLATSPTTTSYEYRKQLALAVHVEALQLHRISDSRSIDAVFATPTGYEYRKQLQNHRKQHILAIYSLLQV